MKLLATLALFILLTQAYGQSANADCGFNPPDTLLFQNVTNIQTIPDIKQLKKITIIDTIKSPLGFVLHDQAHQLFVAIKVSSSWEYWQLPVSGELDATTIDRVDVDNKKSDELLLVISSGVGAYNYKGAINSLKRTTLIYNLDTKQLLLNLVTRYQCDSASHYYTNGNNKRVNTDSLVNLGVDVDNIVSRYTQNITGEKRVYSCAYSFLPKQLTLQGQCKITPYDGNVSTSSFTKNYELLKDGFVAK